MLTQTLFIFFFLGIAIAMPAADDYHKTTTITKTSTTTKTSTVTKTVTSSPSSTLQSFTINYNFDNVGNGLPEPVGGLEQIGELDLLSFDLVLINNNVNNSLMLGTGVNFATFPNVAGFGAENSLEGALSSGVTGLTGDVPLIGPATITASYTESNISYFNPISFFYGCVVNSVESEESLAAACTITADGFDKAGQHVASQTFNYVLTGALLQNMTYGNFSSAFKNLYRMELQVSNNVTVAGLIDNFIATVFQPVGATLYPKPT